MPAVFFSSGTGKQAGRKIWEGCPGLGVPGWEGEPENAELAGGGRSTRERQSLEWLNLSCAAQPGEEAAVNVLRGQGAPARGGGVARSQGWGQGSSSTRLAAAGRRLRGRAGGERGRRSSEERLEVSLWRYGDPGGRERMWRGRRRDSGWKRAEAVNSRSQWRAPGMGIFLGSGWVEGEPRQH